jgi:hypothetical protein
MGRYDSVKKAIAMANGKGFPLTDREKRLFLAACKWYIQYDNSNPDVGFGPSAGTIVEIIAKSAELILTKEDIGYLGGQVNKWQIALR